MDRPCASYFVTLSGDESVVAAAAAAMESRAICPDYLSLSNAEPGLREYDVANGAMDQWYDVEEVFAALAKDFPTLTIEATESCEEPWFPLRDMRFHGENMEVRYGRTLDPDEYDEKTIRVIAELLRSKGMNEAADLALTLVGAREVW